jgi:hypothetical protein
MTGLLHVPFYPDETVMSFLSRMARANGRRSLAGFLEDLGFSPILVKSGTKSEYIKLEKLFGLRPTELASEFVRMGKAVLYLQIPATAILRLVFQGVLSNLAYMESGSLHKNLKVDIEEIRKVLTALQSGPVEASRRSQVLAGSADTANCARGDA